MNVKKSERDEARNELRELLKPSETVWTILRHVSRSGMVRWLDLYVMRDGEPRRITWTVASALPAKYNTSREALEVHGAGEDMGFKTVYDLSISLYCPDKYDHDAAYRLNHRWL